MSRRSVSTQIQLHLQQRMVQEFLELRYASLRVNKSNLYSLKHTPTEMMRNKFLRHVLAIIFRNLFVITL